MFYKSTSILLSLSQSLFVTSPIQCAPPHHFCLISALLLEDFRPPPQRFPPTSLKISAPLLCPLFAISAPLGVPLKIVFSPPWLGRDWSLRPLQIPTLENFFS